MNTIRYNNYHKHTHYSNIRTLDCIVKPIDYINRAKELGHTTYFTGEHGFQGNIFEAQTLCEDNQIKCIYSVEAYYVDDIKDKDRNISHIILVAMNEDGRKEINKILSLANTEGFYYKPRIDLNMLLSLTPKNVIVTTACIASRLNKEDGEISFLKPVLEHFGKSLFLEVQNHNEIHQIEYNKKILKLSKKYNIPIIHANDSHYIKEGDAYYRDLFLEAKGMKYDEETNFILDYPNSDEIKERYKQQGVLSDEDIESALKNTLVFDKAEPININKEFKIPKIVDGDPNEILKNIVFENFKKYKKYINPNTYDKYILEINKELKIIKDCGMAMYFILNNRGVERAIRKYNATLTKSGRGSAVSFLINKFLGLTEVDRLKAPVTLYPTRFMSAERILETRSLPDIDLNFADVKPVVKAFKDILGDDGIYYMVAYKPLQESSAFRLMCKAKGLHISEYNEIAKNIEYYKNDDKWKELYEESKIFEGVIESIAPSPCSFLLLDKPISEEVGLIKVKDEICCCLDGYNCDVYKYVKNDFLTVTVYEIIKEVYEMIGRPIDDISTLINNCDEMVWEIYKRGLTTTINQSDSDYAKHLLTRYKPKSLAEMTAFVAAIRPGFASLLNNFLDRKEYSTGVKDLDDILSDSFHYMLYQESIMKYLVWLGIDEKNTYDIIKKISKKKFTEEALEELKQKLEVGWMNKVGTIDGFEKTWQVVIDAAHYSFNASHALSVAIDSLYGAYLKSHYPMEYFTVVLSLYENDQDRTANLISEMKYFGIKLENPKFGKATSYYLPDKKEKTIYKSVSSIKFLNKTVSNQMYELSQNNYDTFLDLLIDLDKKTSINSRQLNILIELDFFRDFGNINELLFVVKIFDFFKNGTITTLSKNKLNQMVEIFGDKFYDILNKYATDKGKSGNILKSYRITDCMGLLKELQAELFAKGIYDYTFRQKIKAQEDYLGYIDLKTGKKEDTRKLIILDVRALSNNKKIWVYSIRTQGLGSGKRSRVSIKPGVYNKNPVHKYNIIDVKDLHKNKSGYWYLTKYELVE